MSNREGHMSEIDLAVIEHGLTPANVLHIEEQLDELLLPQTIDLTLYRQIGDPALRAHIDRVDVPLYVAGREARASAAARRERAVRR